MTVTGGNGGAAGAALGSGTAGRAGAGGAGIEGASLTIDVFSGSTLNVSGGLSGDGLTRAPALLASGTISLINSTLNLVGGITILPGSLEISSPDAHAFSNVISGTGALIKSGAGTLTLSGANTYSGGTTINAGTLVGDTTSLQGAIVNNGAIVFNQSGSGTYSGSMSGTGTLTKNGPGYLLFFGGSTTYTGLTTINGGTLEVDNTLFTSDILINNGNLRMGIAGSYAGNISGAGSVQFGSIGLLTGSSTVTGGTTFLGGTTRLGVAGGATYTLSGPVRLQQTTFFPEIDIVNANLTGMTLLTNDGSVVRFQNDSAAPSIPIANNVFLGFNPLLSFEGNSTAGGAVITNAVGGQVVFTGASSGGTATIDNSGTVDISGLTTSGTTLGALFGSGSVNLGSKTLILGSSNTSAEISGTIDGAGGSLVKVGSGQLTLSGSNTYTGGTTVSAGRLAVNGSLASGVTVGAAGNLGGSGTINGDVVNNGIVSPGNSIGTLNIVGNYTQAAGSTYQVEVNPSGQSDLIKVSGNATINAGASLAVQAASGRYARSTQYTVLTATGSLNGTFGSVSSNLAFLAPTLSYDAHNIYLTLLAASGAFSSGAQSVNQRSIGVVLDSLSPTAAGDLATVLNALYLLDTSQGPAALDAIGGQIYSGFSTVAMKSLQGFLANFSTLAGGVGGAGRVALAEACDVACDVASDVGTPRWRAWGGGTGSFGTVAGDANAHGTTYTLGGFAGGLDYRFDSRFLAGIAAGYSSATLYTQGLPGQGTSNAVQFGLYGKFVEGPVYLDGIVGYAHADNRLTRQIIFPGVFRTAQGATQADQLFGQLEGGYKVELGGRGEAYVMPFVQLQGMTSTQAGFTESGAGSLNLSVAPQTTNSLRTVLGAQLGGSIDPVAMKFRLGWSHEFADTTRPVTANFAAAPPAAFTVYGASQPREGVVLGLETTARLADRTTFYARYDGAFEGGTASNTISAGLRYVW